MCATNVCRSPTAAKILTAHLPDSLTRKVTTESAGMAANPGQPWCKDAQKWVRRHEFEPGKATHRSRRLTDAMITRADLILAADPEVKSGVLRTSPRARERLFTVLEAATLGGGVHEALAALHEGQLNRNGLHLQTLPRRPGDARLGWLVSEMDAARGLVVPRGNGSRSGVADLPDPHAPGARWSTHRNTLRELSGAVDSLSQTMGLVNTAGL